MRSTLRKPEVASWVILAMAMIVGAVFLFWLERGLAYDGDSFNWMALSGLSPDKALVEPYGGHLIFVPLLVFKVVLEVAGVGYSAFAVPQLLLLLTLSGLIYEYGRRRVGPALALPAPIILIFLGSGWSVLLQPMIGIQFLCALVPGVAALLILERNDRLGDVMGCVLLTIATWSFEMGLAFVAGAAVSIALREDRWKRAWIVGIPIITYGLWKIWAQQYGGLAMEPTNLLWLPAYAVDSLAVVGVSTVGLFYWVGGGQLTYLQFAEFEFSRLGEGLVLLIFEAIAVLFVIRWMRRRGPIPATFWVALATLVTLWMEQCLALGPTRTPGEIRYVVPDTAIVMLVALEAARGLRATRLTLAIAGLLTMAAVIGNLPRFDEGRDLLTAYSRPTKAAITVLQLGGQNISPSFSTQADAPEAFESGRAPYVSAGFITQISAEFGSLGYSVSDLLAQEESVRRTADIVASNALRLKARPVGVKVSATCRPPQRTGDAVALPRGGAVLEAQRGPATLTLRRFADRYVVDLGQLDPGKAVALKIPSDAADVPWRVHAANAGKLAVCPL